MNPTTTATRRSQLLVGSGLLTYPGLVLAAIFGAAWPFAVFAAVSLGVEAVLQIWAPGINWHLTRGGAGWTVRASVRDLAVVIFAATATGYGHTSFVTIAIAMAVLFATRTGYSLIVTFTKVRRAKPVVTRNVDLSALRIPPLRMGPFTDLTARAIVGLSLLPVLGVAASAINKTADATVVGAVAAAALGLIAAVSVAIAGLRALRLPSDERIVAEVHKQIIEYAPELLLYFSGTTDSLYQIDMWLAGIAALPYRTVIVMRERANVRLMAPTSMPVVCVPSAVTLMNFDLPSVAVAMYPANTGKNIHYLRVPGMLHIFIGHGDSDKVASVNPFSKAYDEIWVAGQAGRDRYARAAVGVQDADIVEVGRPQLAPIRHAVEHAPGDAFTVLYAPTWEGWTEDAQNTSLLSMGTTIVAALLAHPAVRVIYKPHPMTGTRDPQALATSHAIMAMIAQASPGDDSSEQMTELRRRIEALGRDVPSADDLDTARNSGLAHPDYAAEAATLTRQWNQAYWAARPHTAHRSVTDPLATLFDCFNQTDLLITDISSVVADYLYSEKPYVVTNSSNLPEDVFRSHYPTASAADLLGLDCAGLDEIVSDMMAGVDPRRPEREKLKSYLLGPDEVLAGDRFARAVDRAVARARAMVPDDVETGEFDPEPEPVAPTSVE